MQSCQVIAAPRISTLKCKVVTFIHINIKTNKQIFVHECPISAFKRGVSPIGDCHVTARCLRSRGDHTYIYFWKGAMSYSRRKLYF